MYDIARVCNKHLELENVKEALSFYDFHFFWVALENNV